MLGETKVDSLPDLKWLGGQNGKRSWNKIDNCMKVMKFGGTSVGSVNSILSVKQIVEAVEEPVIVVVSALGGITDKLINTSQMAANGDSAYEKEYREIVNRHIEMVYTVIPAGNERTVLLDKVNELLSELKDIFQGIYLIKDLSSKTSATIVSYGERLSSIIVASLIKGAVWYDSRNFIKTEKTCQTYSGFRTDHSFG